MFCSSLNNLLSTMVTFRMFLVLKKFFQKKLLIIYRTQLSIDFSSRIWEAVTRPLAIIIDAIIIGPSNVLNIRNRFCALLDQTYAHVEDTVICITLARVGSWEKNIIYMKRKVDGELEQVQILGELQHWLNTLLKTIEIRHMKSLVILGKIS